MKKVVDYIMNFIKFIYKDNISLYAAQSSFFIIISAIPFVMLLLAAARLIMPFESYTLIAVIEPYVPNKFIGMVEYVINEVYDKSASFSILSISTVTLIWSASKGLASLGMGICKIYEQQAAGYVKVRLLSMFYTFLFVLMIIAVLIFIVLGRVFPIISSITEGSVATIFALTMFFSGLYYVASKRKMSYLKNLVGSVTAAMGWFVFSYFFGIYIDKFVDYSYIYGSLGIIVVFMIWLYFCMNIILIGAEINMYIFGKEDI